MGKLGRDALVGLLLLIVVIAGCSSEGSEGAADVPNTDDEASEDAQAAAGAEGIAAADSVEERCQQGAEAIADRLDQFIMSFGDVTPDEFLGRTEIDGLTDFQDDVAQLISATANQSSTLCNLDGLQVFVDAELAGMEKRSLLANVLVSSIRFGGSLEQADVALGPDDDLLAIMSLLDDGSSVTLSEGVFELDVAVLVQRDLVIVGAGVGRTTLSSTSADAAVAVFGQGKLTLRDLTVEHVGDAPSSIILAFGAPVDVERVHVRGAVSSDDEQEGGAAIEDSSGGNGILLSTGVVSDEGVTGEAPADALPVASSRIVDSEISENAIAGVTVIGDLDPLIASNHVHSNVLCGICFLDGAGGTAQENLVEKNEFGIQVGGNAAPTLVENTSSTNAIAGMVILDTATPTIVDNVISDNGEVGIAVQGAASPIIQRNVVEGHLFGMTFVGTSTASVLRTTVSGAEVGIQVAEEASPELAENTIVDAVSVGIVHRDSSSGTFDANTIRGSQAVGVLIEGSAQPTIRTIRVEGSEVGMSYRERAAGTLSESEFIDPAIGVQLEDEATPEITSNIIERPQAAGLVIRSSGTVIVRNNTILEPESLGIGLAGESKALIESNTVTGGETAISFVEMAQGEARNNTLSGQVVSIQVGDSAAPLVAENQIEDATGAAIVFRDESGGTARQNTILRPRAVGIQVVEMADPVVEENVLLADLDAVVDDPDQSENNGGSEPEPQRETDGENEPEDGLETEVETADGTTLEAGEPDEPETAAETEGDTDDSTVGILFAGDAQGSAVGNQVFGFVIGIQVSESAAPTLSQNLIDGGALNGVGVLYRDTGAGSGDENVTTAHSIGFQVSDEAKPVLINNTVERATDAAFVIQGSATPEISGSTCPASIPGIGILDQAAPVLTDNACATTNG